MANATWTNPAASFRAALLALMLSVSGPTAAAGWFSASIAYIELTSSGELIVFLSGPTNHECGSKRVDYINPGDATSRAFLAALLTWKAQAVPVSVYIASCNGTIGVFNVVMNQQ